MNLPVSLESAKQLSNRCVMRCGGDTEYAESATKSLIFKAAVICIVAMSVHPKRRLCARGKPLGKDAESVKCMFPTPIADPRQEPFIL